MLRRLSVENYVLIDKLEMELDPHLNIITGETGAGKSILLGALGLLLGAKNDGSAMKDAARNCVVEGTFDLSGRDMEAFFAGNDLDYAPETTVTRMITPTGKSRAFINDLPVQLAQLREFGTRLIDIHSQHQNLILSSEEFRTSALDTVAGNGNCSHNMPRSTRGLRNCGAGSPPCAKPPPTDAATRSGSASRAKNSRLPTCAKGNRPPSRKNWPYWRTPTASARCSLRSATPSMPTKPGCSRS